MPSLNRVELEGNLVADPQILYDKAGNPRAKFAIAVDKSYKDRDGQKCEDTQFPPCTAFGKQAEIAAQWLKKGSWVHDEGSLQQNRWEDPKTKEKRSSWGVSLYKVLPLVKTAGPESQPAVPQEDSPPVDPQTGF